MNLKVFANEWCAELLFLGGKLGVNSIKTACEVDLFGLLLVLSMYFFYFCQILKFKTFYNN